MDAELRRLQGTWQAVRLETAAGPVPDETARQLRYAFDGDRVTLLEGGRETGVGTIILDPSAIPKRMDVEMTSGPGQGQAVRGIYEIDGNRLRLCIGPERPTAFDPSGPASLAEMERVAQ